MEASSKKSPWIWGISFLSAWFAVISLFADRAASADSLVPMVEAMNGRGLGPALTLLAGTWAFHYVYGIRNRREQKYALAGAILFGICQFFGFNISCWDSLLRIGGGVYGAALDGACFLGACLIHYGILLTVFHWLLRHPVEKRRQKTLDRWFGYDRRSFFRVFGILMAAYLLLLLFYYPGITTQDTSMQIAESVGWLPISDHNPYVHTLLMTLCIRLGRAVFGTMAAGIALFTVVQTVLIALSVSFLMTYLARRQINGWLRLCVLGFFLLQPVALSYSVIVWKDIWLSYFLMLYTLLLTEIAVNPQGFFRRNRHLAALAGVILGFLFSKNTGILVLVLTLPFLFHSAKQYWKQLLTVTAVCLIVLGISRIAIIPGFGIIKGRVGEPLSVPLQQIARVCAKEGDSLTEEQKTVISEILPLDRLPQLYNPVLSDAVKGSLNDEAFAENPMRYLGLWGKLGLEHPRAYLESFLANSYGYWYPEVPYTQIVEDSYFTGPIAQGEFGNLDPDMETYSFRGAGPAGRHLVFHLFETFRGLPGMEELLSVAFYFWGALFLALLAGLKKRRRLLLPLGVSLAVFLTCILSPVFAECRYAFPALLMLPVVSPFLLQDSIAVTDNMGPEKPSVYRIRK